MLLEFEHRVRFVEKRKGVLGESPHLDTLAPHYNRMEYLFLLVTVPLALVDREALWTCRLVTLLERKIPME